QQASTCNGEQQHRWPAYNVNVALLQASTKGLFQHTRLLSVSLLVDNLDVTRTRKDSYQAGHTVLEIVRRNDGHSICSLTATGSLEHRRGGVGAFREPFSI